MNQHLKTLFILFPLIVALSFSGIYLSISEKITNVISPGPSDGAAIPVSTAREAVGYIKDKDFTSLSNFVDDRLGVLVSPYYAFGGNQGRTLTKNEIKNFLSDNGQKLWGYEDGSGRGILLTNAGYYNKYIYSSDFVTLGNESINTSLANGNTLPLDEVLANAFKSLISKGGQVQYVEYYISGFDPKYEGMDWESLALIFMKLNGSWKLIGIFHNQWTI